MKYVFGLFTGLVIGGVLGFLIHGAIIEIETDAAIAALRKEMEEDCDEKTKDALNDQRQELENSFRLAEKQREQFWRSRVKIVRDSSIWVGFQHGESKSNRECSEKISETERRLKKEYTSILKDVKETYKDAEIKDKRRRMIENNSRGDPDMPVVYEDVWGDKKEVANPTNTSISTDQFVKSWFLGLGCFLLLFLIIRRFRRDFNL